MIFAVYDDLHPSNVLNVLEIRISFFFFCQKLTLTPLQSSWGIPRFQANASNTLSELNVEQMWPDRKMWEFHRCIWANRVTSDESCESGRIGATTQTRKRRDAAVAVGAANSSCCSSVSYTNVRNSHILYFTLDVLCFTHFSHSGACICFHMWFSHNSAFFSYFSYLLCNQCIFTRTKDLQKVSSLLHFFLFLIFIFSFFFFKYMFSIFECILLLLDFNRNVF